MQSSASVTDALLFQGTGTGTNSSPRVQLLAYRLCCSHPPSTYTILSIAIADPGSGYAVGDFIEIAYGTPALLATVSAIDGLGGGITGITILNNPAFSTAPTTPAVPTVTQSGTGSDATFTIVAAKTIKASCRC
jgi:hypothetical protein